jgi:hypothetical protein
MSEIPEDGNHSAQEPTLSSPQPTAKDKKPPKRQHPRTFYLNQQPKAKNHPN